MSHHLITETPQRGGFVRGLCPPSYQGRPRCELFVRIVSLYNRISNSSRRTANPHKPFKTELLPIASLPDAATISLRFLCGKVE